MLAVLSDTHGTADHRLAGAAADAVTAADRVIHAGDFTTPAVLDAFEAAAPSLDAVYGNNDVPTVRELLPATTVVEALGLRIVVAHGHEHDETSLALLARQEDADVAVVGHSHVAGVERVGELVVLNPGSHADPRGRPATHAELRRGASGVEVRVRTRDGEAIESVEL